MTANNYLSHLADDEHPQSTACGEPWQGWQAPSGLPPLTLVLSPHSQPRPHQDNIRLCVACQRLGLVRLRLRSKMNKAMPS